MSLTITEIAPDVKVYGGGYPGGKGLGLARINDCLLPRAQKLKTRILTTMFYDRFMERGGRFEKKELDIVRAAVEELGDVPVGVRSSATNEAATTVGGAALIQAGVYMSFMLPNNHPDPGVRFRQVLAAIAQIYKDFALKQTSSSREKMAVILNPIPGIFDDTLAGPCYYPYVSGVANSYFPHALKTQDPKEGFARIAFGHGYATVLDDFPVIPMATIKNPLPPRLLRIGNGQQFFYSLDMTKNAELEGVEMETMKKLHVSFADVRKIGLLGLYNNRLTIEELILRDRFRFQTGLSEIMETISARISTFFQIEFVFNIDFSAVDRKEGTFAIVQLLPLPELRLGSIRIPGRPRHTYLSIRNAQGHGLIRGIRHALVVSPFTYARERHDEVRDKISAANRELQNRRERYILIVPGRLGSQNREWGIYVDYKDVDGATAIFEYGVDISGRAEPLPEDQDLTGGTYGSHFLYMIQGGYDEDQRRRQTRMYGTQGTHFLTNLTAHNVIYGYVAPGLDKLDPWFFSSSGSDEGPSLLTFPRPVTLYADSLRQRCKVILEQGE